MVQNIKIVWFGRAYTDINTGIALNIILIFETNTAI